MVSLRMMMAAGTLAGLVGLNWTLAAIALGETRDEERRLAIRVETAAANLAQQTHDVLNTVDRTLSGIGEVLRVHPHADRRGDLSVHTLLVRRHAITGGIRTLLVIDPAGRPVHDSLNRVSPDVDLTDRDYWQALSSENTDALFVGNPVRSRLDHEWIIPVARRENDNFGRLRFVVGAGLSPEPFAEMLAAQNLPPGTRAVILGPSGQPLACLPEGRCFERTELRNLPAELAQQPAHTPDAAWLPGPRGPASRVLEERYGFLVVVNGAAAAGWHSRGHLYLALAVLGSLAMVALGFVLYRQMLRRRAALRELERVNAGLEDAVAARTRELSKSEARLRLLLDTARDAVVVTDEHGIIQGVNPACERLFEYDPGALRGIDVSRLMPTYPAGERERGDASSSPRAGLAAGGRELTGLKKDGTAFPVELTVGTSLSDGTLVHVGVVRDVTERRQVMDALHRLATTDSLTGMMNRRQFMEEATKAFRLARRHGRPLTVALIDADRFKSVNDTYGHHVGDEVLKALAEALGHMVRATDVLGRLGGEEFALVLPETEADGAREWGERILASVRARAIALEGGGELRVTVSVGLASMGAGTGNLDDLLRRADEALYRAKRDGRDRVVEAEGERPERPAD